MNREPPSPTPDPVEEAIFHAAIELDVSKARAAFLDRACGGDRALRTRIETLLAADLRARQFLAEDPLDLGSKPRPKPVITSPEQSAGDQIGRYKLLEKIGEGGMGVVYMAEQREPVVRKVALKIIKPGMDTRQVVARFEAERQALALMDHPNIARVLDGGVTDNSRPYFVMDLVQGVPITQFCDERNLSTRARLDLFLEVCSAIQHAHQKGIIHRDIKPTNILVTLHGDKPVPKVIDFGVAKATQQRLTDKTLFTQFQHFIGTPAYMSPEQASLSGLDIDTRSDIYGLGVLLYELLTGKTPFDARELVEAGLDQMRRTIQEKEPVRPSTRLNALQRDELTTTAKRRQTDAPKLLHQLRGDLDWIVMKCLEKDRNRRYETTNGLAADIKRHLSNEPISARPPSRLYEFQKTVRRHRVAFAATAAVLLTLAGGVAVSSWQAVKAKRAEQSAKAQEQLAKQQAQIASEQSEIANSVIDFLIQQVLGVNPFVGGEVDPQRAALLKKAEREVETTFASQPEIEAKLRMALGLAFFGIGDFAHAIEQYEKALAIRQKEFGPTHSDTLEAIGSAAWLYVVMGRSQMAESLLPNAIAWIESTPHPVSRGEIDVLFAQAKLLIQVDRAEEALPYAQRAMDIARQTLDPKSVKFHTALNHLAHATLQAGRCAEAEKLADESVRLARQYFGPEHGKTLNAEINRGGAYRRQGRFQDEVTIYLRVLPLLRRSFGTNHFLTVNVEFMLGLAYENLGQGDQAARQYADVRLESYFPHPQAQYAAWKIANFFARQGRFERARAAFALLREFCEAHAPEGPADLERFAEATAATKGWSAAAALYRKEFNFSRFSDAQIAAVGCLRAAVLQYAGDVDGYTQERTKLLTSASAITNIDVKQWIAEIAGLNPLDPSPSDQITKCAELARSLEKDAANRSATDTRLNRVIAALDLRCGHYSESLARLQNVLTNAPSGLEHAQLLVLKSLNLHQLERRAEARAAFDEAEAFMKPLLLEHLVEREGFLERDERNYLIFRREALALPGLQ